MKVTNIEIYGVRWTVAFVDKDYSALANRDNFSLGTCLYRTHEIFIAEGQPSESELNTLYHELTHAIIYQMTLHKDSYDDEDMAKFVGTYADYIVSLAQEILRRTNL